MTLDFRKFSLAELQSDFQSMGIKKKWAEEAYKAVWKEHLYDFGGMTQLSPEVIEKLQKRYFLKTIEEKIVRHSDDGTIKFGFELSDERMVEGVLIPKGKRMTACVSSQVGCSLNCTFCATARLKRERNLDASEIYDQIAIINRYSLEKYGLPLTNVVLMGMGEPLLNYIEVMRFIQLATDQKYGPGIAARKITLSTSGVAKGIRRLAEDYRTVSLALSLHAVRDEIRSKIMDINLSNPLPELRDSLVYYYEKTGKKITLEYILFKDLNDTDEDARLLVEFCKGLHVFVNILEYNPIEGGDMEGSDKERFFQFRNILESNGVATRTRFSRGKDIDAACGQLVTTRNEG